MLNEILSYENVLKRNLRPINFTTSNFEYLASQRILITGAGGSIGSRISKFVSTIPDLDFLATDRDESSLHSLSLQISNKALFDDNRFRLMDIKDSQDIVEVFELFKPTLVIHAAALKHLSVLENQPNHALKTNIYGTANLLEISNIFGVNTFINISTDKAAQATSVLGKSKSIAEIYGYLNSGSMIVKSCRFGNVFASRGSVIETFASQMLSKKPITLTNLDVTRFFMHPDEAGYLSVKSSLLNGKSIYIFEMGSPILLVDIINRMQELLGTTSPIVITGMRAGEKQEESLLNLMEIEEPTSDPNIKTTELKVNLDIDYVGDLVRKRNSDLLLDILQL